MPEVTKITAASQRVTVAARKKAKQEIFQNMEFLNAADWIEITERANIFGKPAPALVKYRDKILEFAIKNKIKYIDKGLLIGIPPLDFIHAHFDEKIYLFDEKQFKALDKAIVDEFKVSLEKAGAIKF